MVYDFAQKVTAPRTNENAENFLRPSSYNKRQRKRDVTFELESAASDAFSSVALGELDVPREFVEDDDDDVLAAL